LKKKTNLPILLVCHKSLFAELNYFFATESENFSFCITLFFGGKTLSRYYFTIGNNVQWTPGETKKGLV